MYNKHQKSKTLKKSIYCRTRMSTRLNSAVTNFTTLSLIPLLHVQQTLKIENSKEIGLLSNETSPNLACHQLYNFVFHPQLFDFFDTFASTINIKNRKILQRNRSTVERNETEFSLPSTLQLCLSSPNLFNLSTLLHVQQTLKIENSKTIGLLFDNLFDPFDVFPRTTSDKKREASCDQKSVHRRTETSVGPNLARCSRSRKLQAGSLILEVH